MHSLTNLQETIKQKALQYRNIHLCLLTDQFKLIWDALNKEDQQHLMTLALQGDKTIFFSRIKKSQYKLLGEMSVAELRLKAKEKGIPKFMLMNKVALLTHLSKYEGEL